MMNDIHGATGDWCATCHASSMRVVYYSGLVPEQGPQSSPPPPQGVWFCSDRNQMNRYWINTSS
jgi:hypothetical protein